MIRRKLLCLPLIAAALVACGSDAAPEVNVQLPADKSTESLLATLKASATGFSTTAANVREPIYVVFDPQCPHCGHLWEMLKPYRTQRNFIWVPITMLRAPANRPQGAMLLGASDPVALMDVHETSIAAHEGGIPARDTKPELMAKVDANTKIVRHFELDGVPALVFRHPGGVEKLVGVPTAEGLKAILGS